jgi:hypothetical protein
MGGNAPIMAHALGCLGAENYCISMMGVDEVHPVFKQMHFNCTLVSIGEPAVSHALEFDDGKLILSEVSSFDNVDLEYLLKIKDEKFILDIINESKLLSLVDWSNLPRCTNLWNSLYHLIKEHNVRDKIYFFDLCDPSKKTNLEILEALQVIEQFADVGKVILGLNENEALKIFYALHGVNPNDGNSIKDFQLGDLTKVSSHIFEKLEVDMLLVHPVDRSIVVTKERLVQMQGKVINHPKILTGGGDNLNAGFCLGLLNNLSIEECMLAGMATSGAYVQNGFSPSMDDLIEYLKTYN